MVSNEQVKSSLEAAFPNAIVDVDGDGYHYQITVVSDKFSGLNRVKRQQEIYAVLNPFIASGELHAISAKTLTLIEWEETKNG